MSYGASAALQQAVYQALLADPALDTLVQGAIYDALPQGTLPPLYVTLGPEDVRDATDGTGDGAWHRFTVSVVTDGAGFHAAKEAAVPAATTNAHEQDRAVISRSDISVSPCDEARCALMRSDRRKTGSGRSDAKGGEEHTTAATATESPRMTRTALSATSPADVASMLHLIAGGVSRGPRARRRRATLNTAYHRKHGRPTSTRRVNTCAQANDPRRNTDRRVALPASADPRAARQLRAPSQAHRRGCHERAPPLPVHRLLRRVRPAPSV